MLGVLRLIKIAPRIQGNICIYQALPFRSPKTNKTPQNGLLQKYLKPKVILSHTDVTMRPSINATNFLNTKNTVFEAEFLFSQVKRDACSYLGLHKYTVTSLKYNTCVYLHTYSPLS